jgi:hypothetical protein
MRKILFIYPFICLLILSGCGGGGSGSESSMQTSEVTIMTSMKSSSVSSIKASSSDITQIRYSVTGPGMEPMTGTRAVIDRTVEFILLVPNGPDRNFVIEALDALGNVLYKGEAKADLRGLPVVLTIQLEQVNLKQCEDTVQAGSNNPVTLIVELEKNSGTFRFDYETYSVKDQMIVTYEGEILFDSGCVGTNGWKTEEITYAGVSTAIEVKVIPNCEGTSSTAWEFIVHCPEPENTPVDVDLEWPD